MDETSSNINAEETNCLPRATGNRQGTEPLGHLKVTQWGQKKKNSRDIWFRHCCGTMCHLYCFNNTLIAQ